MKSRLPHGIPQGGDKDHAGTGSRSPVEDRHAIFRSVASSDRPTASGRTRSRTSGLPLDRSHPAPDGPLATYDDFREAVSRRRQPLKPQLAKAATFLLDHPDDVAFDTLRTLASRAGVSPSTFVRLAQSLGLPSFSNLRKLFEQRLVSNASASVLSIGRDRLSHVIETAEQELREIDVSVSGAAITKAAQVLAPADTIFLVGLKAMPALMSSLRRGLTASGMRHLIVDQVPGMATEMIAFATSADAAVVASSGPIEPETQAIIDRLVDSNVPFVTFGDDPDRGWAGRSRSHFDLSDDRRRFYDLSIGALCLTTSLVHALCCHRVSPRVSVAMGSQSQDEGLLCL